MIRLVGAANYRFDLAPINAGEDWGGVLNYPDATPYVELPPDALAFWLVVDYDGESPCSPFVLLPKCPEDRARFERVRTCLAQCEIARQPPDYRLIGSVASWLDAERAKLETRWQEIQSAKDAVTQSPCFLEALKQILARPLSLMPARPKGFDCVLYSNRLWTTREVLSDEDWSLLVQEYDDRKHARLQALASKYRPGDASGESHRTRLRAGSPQPSYQTLPLTAYRVSFRNQAEALYQAVRYGIGHRAKKYKGSYSIFATSSGETAAKIVIYQRGLGRENGVLPTTIDGVYVLVRTNGAAGRLIWDSGLVSTLGYDRRLDPERTIGIAPRHQERFAYFRMTDEDELRSIADLLTKCSIV